MSVTPTVLPTEEAVGDAIAEHVLAALAAGQGQFLLGCPAGRTPTAAYRALARLVHERAIDLSGLVIVMMDDYVETAPDGELRRVDPERSYSCLGFARREIEGPLRAATAAAGTHGPAALWSPDPADPEAYDRAIEQAGGVDLFLLASGASDGHIAFNQPGTPRESRTHLVELGEATRRDNMGTFKEFTSLDMVPTRGISVGLDTIAALSREVVMTVAGAHKRQAFARLAAADGYEPDWPATVFAECKNPLLYADSAAAGVRTQSPNTK